MNNTALMILLAVVLCAAIIGVIILVLASKNAPKLRVERYQTRWLEIENSLSRTVASSWQVAIMDADKLLDQALKDRHFKGQTMGERMKSASKSWRNANHVWGAHKIRNQLAHETDVKLTYETTVRALTAFKQGLKDLGAI